MAVPKGFRDNKIRSRNSIEQNEHSDEADARRVTQVDPDGEYVGTALNPTYFSSLNELFSKPFTRITVLSKNDDGDPLTIRSSFNGNPVQLLTITYDSDGDFQDANVTDL